MTTQRNEQTDSADAIYDDPALIPLYDILNSADHDHVFYRQEIPADARKVIDLGCGTGRFAIDLARRGYEVTALDPAPAMIDFARRQDGADAVNWFVGTASDIPAGLAADAAVMMGHAFQCLTTDQAIDSTLLAIRNTLRPGGRFLFESRNPQTGPWRHWNKRQEISSDSVGFPVAIDRQVVEVNGDLVSFEEHFSFSEKVVTSRSTLRFLGEAEIVAHLQKTGFKDITVFGFWDRRPFSDDSPEMIFAAA
ncbi:class I SAM-dependent methyltransferase [Hwanghaeella grinnelliae]|uniref:Class I SAM-dependent methyltransferase n=1 Tax=Hwanghaeella grinnelliae TaxID=2500179 RepID=A0A437QJK7_9PROT|nr:class I SAM-dependent methyltransferase [Hwanghaeella grinnelliae]RVU34689.1 class I SAM-dependent methyltransferase [Hwanghaeella grinnelliae]